MPTYAADHVGSFLRPQELMDARVAHAEGHLSIEALRAAENAAIEKILDVQRQAGIDVFSDGEYRRGMWTAGPLEAIDGFIQARISNTGHWRGDPIERDKITKASTQPGAVIGGKLTAKKRITGDESAYLKQHSPGPYKITMPSPTWYLRGYHPDISPPFYPTPADALKDLVGIAHDEVRALVEEGTPYVQIDSIRYVFDFTDDQRRQEWEAQGIDPDKAIDENVDADNAVIEGLKRDGVTFALHMCRGNNMSRWFAEGSYDRIAEKAFANLNYDRFLLEYDSERAGGFEPLRFIPKGKTVVLGLISTKTSQLESQDDLRRRIDEASKFVPIDNLAISPQCGFASVAAGNELTWDEQRRKIELIVDTARKVWG